MSFFDIILQVVVLGFLKINKDYLYNTWSHRNQVHQIMEWFGLKGL